MKTICLSLLFIHCYTSLYAATKAPEEAAEATLSPTKKQIKPHYATNAELLNTFLYETSTTKKNQAMVDLLRNQEVDMKKFTTILQSFGNQLLTSGQRKIFYNTMLPCALNEFLENECGTTISDQQAVEEHADALKRVAIVTLQNFIDILTGKDSGLEGISEETAYVTFCNPVYMIDTAKAGDILTDKRTIRFYWEQLRDGSVIFGKRITPQTSELDSAIITGLFIKPGSPELETARELLSSLCNKYFQNVGHLFMGDIYHSQKTTDALGFTIPVDGRFYKYNGTPLSKYK